MQNETTLYGIRAILEAIDAGKSIDKIFLQKGLRGELFLKLEKQIRQHRINCSYVPIEKLNRLTPNNHQGAVAQIAPIQFQDLDQLIAEVLSVKKTRYFLF
jgi:23S rRNA (guanosine2251-2'-O)-methyltransferase